MATRPTSKYESDSGSIHKITATSNTLGAAGAAPEGDIDSDIIVKISKGNREYGIRPRKVTLSRIVGTAPNDFRAYKRIPVLTPTSFAATGFQLGATITIGSQDWTVIARQPEDF